MDFSTLIILGLIGVALISIGGAGRKLVRKAEALTDLPQNLEGGPLIKRGFTFYNGEYVFTKRISPNILKHTK